jgi:hypothetical protein
MTFEINKPAEIFVLPEPIDAEAPATARASVKPPANVDGVPAYMLEGAASMSRQITGIQADGQQHRHDIEQMVGWRSGLQSRGLWSEAKEEAYQTYRAKEVEFWRQHQIPTEKYSARHLAGLFRYEWTTKIGSQFPPDVTRIAMLELGLALLAA